MPAELWRPAPIYPLVAHERSKPLINITPQAIEKFLSDSRRYLAHENPRIKLVAGPLAPTATKSRQPTPVHTRWEFRSSL
jgi:hypothetical protein